MRNSNQIDIDDVNLVLAKKFNIELPGIIIVITTKINIIITMIGCKKIKSLHKYNYKTTQTAMNSNEIANSKDNTSAPLTVRSARLSAIGSSVDIGIFL